MEGGTTFVGVFRVKNHDFTPKIHIFSNFRGAPDPPLITTTKSWTDVVTSLMPLWFCLDALQLQQPLPLFDII